MYCSIGRLPRLLVSSADGYLYIYNIDPEEGGDCTLLKQHRCGPLTDLLCGRFCEVGVDSFDC